MAGSTPPPIIGAIRALALLWVLAGSACDNSNVDVGSNDALSGAETALDATEPSDAGDGVGAEADAALSDAADVAPGDVAQPPDVPVSLSLCARAIIDQPKVTPPGKWLADSKTQEAVKGSHIKLCGDHSLPSVAGDVISWNWTVEQEPGGMPLKLVPKAEGPPCVQFTAMNLGLYKLCLNVIDAAFEPGCKQTCINLEVYSPPGIYVELSWQTTGDTNHDDSGPGAGADLDLHFAHKFAQGQGIQDDCKGAPYPWFDKKFDLFAAQPKAQWGNASPTVLDDPSLNDSDDGTTPEVLHLPAPEGGAATGAVYTVGVHYWDDHGYGPSIARVRVFMESLPVVDVSLKMKPADMWTVGRIYWPNSLSGSGVKAVPWQNCLQEQPGDPCDGGSGPWGKPPGHACVNACFVPTGWGAGNPPAKGDCD